MNSLFKYLIESGWCEGCDHDVNECIANDKCMADYVIKDKEKEYVKEESV